MAKREHDLRLEWLPGRYAVCRLEPTAEVPGWAQTAIEGDRGLLSITRTERELSIVAPETIVPVEVRRERGWVALRVVGQLDFDLVGVLASLVQPLAQAGVSVFALSTYDTDILLLKEEQQAAAIEALRGIEDE